MVEDVVAGPAAEQQEDEGIVVEEPGDLVAEGGGVLAGEFPAVAGAGGVEVADAGEQRYAGVGSSLDQVVRHLTVEQCRDVPRTRRHPVEEPAPRVVGQFVHLNDGLAGVIG